MPKNRIGFRLGFAVIAVVTSVSVGGAATVTVQGTESGGNAVWASADVTFGNGTLTITLQDLEASPRTVAQAISDFDFTLSNGATTGSLVSSSGQEVTVSSDGTYALGNTVSTGWALNNNFSGGLQLDALGVKGVTPSHLILGPAPYCPKSGCGSIAGNGPHNPFLNQTATFTLAVAGVTADTTLTGATFSFGTTAGDNVCALGCTAMPEASTVDFLAADFGLMGLVGAVFYMRRKRDASARA